MLAPDWELQFDPQALMQEAQRELKLLGDWLTGALALSRPRRVRRDPRRQAEVRFGEAVLERVLAWLRTSGVEDEWPYTRGIDEDLVVARPDLLFELDLEEAQSRACTGRWVLDAVMSAAGGASNIEQGARQSPADYLPGPLPVLLVLLGTWFARDDEGLRRMMMALPGIRARAALLLQKLSPLKSFDDIVRDLIRQSRDSEADHVPKESQQTPLTGALSPRAPSSCTRPVPAPGVVAA